MTNRTIDLNRREQPVPRAVAAPRTSITTATADLAPNEPVRLAERRLQATLAAEDRAETERGLSPHERITCRLHRRWAYQCIASPQHVIAVTGHRWCDDCATAVSVAVDELTGNVTLTCPRCHRTPNTRATDQIIRTCQASLRAAHRVPHQTGDTAPTHQRLTRSRTA